MYIIEDNNIGCFSIKRSINDKNYVRIGVLLISFWINGKVIRQKKLEKQGFKFTIGECRSLLEELERGK